MRYLTTGEVASRCQGSVGTVKNWIDADASAAPTMAPPRTPATRTRSRPARPTKTRGRTPQ